MLIDGGSSIDLLLVHAFDQLHIPQSWLSPSQRPLQGFNGGPIDALEQIELLVTFDEGSIARTKAVTFNVVDVPYTYNVILGRGILNKF